MDRNFDIDFFIKNGCMSSVVKSLGSTLLLNLGAIMLLEKRTLLDEN